MKKIKVYLTDYQNFKSADIVCEPEDLSHLKEELLKKFFSIDSLKNVRVFCQDENSGYDLRQSKKLVDGNSFNGDLLEVQNGTVCGIAGMVGVLNRTVKIDKEEYDVTLEMRSRFDERDKPYFLGTMLASVLQSGELFTTIENNVASGAPDLFGFLSVTLFCSMLKSAHKSGTYKTYVRKEYNDSKLHGAINVPRHIRLNVGRNDAVIAYASRELTYDNELNHLILHTWKFLKEEYASIANALLYGNNSDDELYGIISELKNMTSATNIRLERCAAKCRRPITGPFYTEYEELRKLCLRIISYQNKANIFSGDGENVGGILFYSPDLWEAYLEKIMREYMKKCKRKGILKEYELKPQEKLRVYGEDTPSIRPDFVICKKTDENELPAPVAVLDAKFRYREKTENPPWFANSDDWGDFGKLLRDMMCFGVNIGGFILPYKEKSDKAESSNTVCVPHGLGVYNKTHKICTYYMIVPCIRRCVTYREWNAALKESTNRMLESLKDNLPAL